MNLQLMILIIINYLSFLSSAAKYEYYDYERNLRYQASAYDWSEEEVPFSLREAGKETAPMTYWNMWWESTPWAVGIRGLYANNKYAYERCMGILIRKYVVLTLCPCVCTWYTTWGPHRERRMASAVPETGYCDRSHDIGTSTLSVFFKFYVSVPNDTNKITTESVDVLNADVPKSPGCDKAAIQQKLTDDFYGSFVILKLFEDEVDAVFENCVTDMSPPWPPEKIIEREDFSRSNLTTYGASPQKQYVVKDEKGEIIDLQHHPITVQLKVGDGPECFNTRTFSGVCYQASFDEVCGFLPGSPIITTHNDTNKIDLLAMVTNRLDCHVERSGHNVMLHTIGLHNAMPQIVEFERSYVEEKVESIDIPWDENTPPPSYLDVFPPDELLNMYEKSDKQRRSAAIRKMPITAVFFWPIQLLIVFLK